MHPIKGTSKMAGVLMRRQVAKHPESRFHTTCDKHIAHDVDPSPASTRLSAAQSPRAMAVSKSQAQTLTRLCTPCPYPTTYVPDTGQFTRPQYTELALHFQSQVKSLWRKVWFGLYQVQDKHGPSHASQIRKLYASAGMAEVLKRNAAGRLDDMYRLFWGKWEMVGLGNLSKVLCERPMSGSGSNSHQKQPVLGQLKLYDGIALDNLHFIVVLLREYEHQVDAISELYKFLQQHQMSENEEPTMAHQTSLLRGFRERADTMATTLSDLDEQLLALQGQMEIEAREIHGGLEGVDIMVLMEEIL